VDEDEIVPEATDAERSGDGDDVRFGEDAAPNDDGNVGVDVALIEAFKMSASKNPRQRA